MSTTNSSTFVASGFPQAPSTLTGPVSPAMVPPRDLPSLREMRVGFVSWTDPENPCAMAGMPFRMAQALRARVGELITFSPEGGSGLRRQPLRPRTWPGIGRVIRHVQWRWLTFDGSIRRLEHYYPGHTRRRTLRIARRASSWLLAEAARHQLDALFGCIVTWPLHEVTDEPTVFFTDATTTMVNSTYPRFADRCRGFKEACATIEDRVYARSFAVAAPADAVIDSAIAHHGLSRSKGHVIPMGANIVPEVPLEGVEHLSAPDRDDLKLTIIASDPVRKRLDFAVDVAARLNELGWRCRLTAIGLATDKARTAAHVDHLGPLQWSVPPDRKKMQDALSNGHFFILPSTAEGAAISPAEAAHFGRPSIVSDVAGFPTVVHDGRTGRVLPLSSSVDDYARAIVDIAGDRARYRAMSEAALTRAQSVFTWDAWGQSIAALLAQAVHACSKKPRS